MDIINSLTENRTGVIVALVILVGVVMLIVAAVYFIRLLKMFRPVHDQLMPLGGKIAFWGAVAYTLLPFDVLPDPLLFDDIGVLALAVTYINSLVSQLEIEEQAVADG